MYAARKSGQRVGGGYGGTGGEEEGELSDAQMEELFGPMGDEEALMDLGSITDALPRPKEGAESPFVDEE